MTDQNKPPDRVWYDGSMYICVPATNAKIDTRIHTEYIRKEARDKELDTLNQHIDKLIKGYEEALQPIRDVMEEPHDEEKTMKQWDYYRELIARGNKGSSPRDWFESVTSHIIELEKSIKETLRLVDSLP